MAMSTTDSERVNITEIKAKKFFITKKIMIIIVISSFVAILIALAVSGINLGGVFNSWTDSYYILFGALGVYVIIFLISTFANMTILFPVPYAVALAYIALRIYDGTIENVNIWFLGIIAGSGAAIGEITAYYLGKGSAALMESKEKSESVERMKMRIKRGWAVPLMFLCAATFIPDDPLLILLGYCGYPLWKMLITYFVGKIVLCVGTIYLVILAQDIPVVADFFWILGITDKPVDPWFSFLAWIGVLFLFLLIFFVDWTNQFKKLYRKISKNKNSEIESSELKPL